MMMMMIIIIISLILCEMTSFCLHRRVEPPMVMSHEHTLQCISDNGRSIAQSYPMSDPWCEWQSHTNGSLWLAKIETIDQCLYFLFDLHSTFRRVRKIAKIKTTIGFVMSVRPCTLTHGITGRPRGGFWWNVILEYFSKICRGKLFFH